MPEAVQAWAGPEVAVQGCLVLATGAGFYNKREYEDGRVVVHGPKSLMNALRGEATAAPWPGASGSSPASTAIWPRRRPRAWSAKVPARRFADVPEADP